MTLSPLLSNFDPIPGFSASAHAIIVFLIIQADQLSLRISKYISSNIRHSGFYWLHGEAVPWLSEFEKQAKISSLLPDSKSPCIHTGKLYSKQCFPNLQKCINLFFFFLRSGEKHRDSTLNNQCSIEHSLRIAIMVSAITIPFPHLPQFASHSLPNNIQSFLLNPWLIEPLSL